MRRRALIAFGAFAFCTPAMLRRVGMNRLLGLAMVALVAGIAIRLQSSLVALFLGTVLAGAAIAVGNVLMPSAIKEDFAHCEGLTMGLYSTALFVGAAAASGLTVPLLPLTGGDWHLALALWTVPALLAAVIWLPQVRRSPSRSMGIVTVAPGEDAEPPLRAILGDRTAIAVTALMGLQSVGYYAALTWVPSVLQAAGINGGTSGWMLSFSAVPGIIASLVTPGIARRLQPSWLPVAASVSLTAAAYAGLAIAPTTATYLWMIFLGLGQGASISLSLTYIVWRAPDTHHTGHLSTMAQGFGYLLAGLGPVGIGAVHSLTGTWLVPLVVLGLLLVGQLLAGVVAGRPVHIRARVTQ